MSRSLALPRITYPSPPFLIPRRSPDSHKGDYGRVLLIGGSRGMSGSISLSAMAALRAGSGLVTALVPACCLETVAALDPCIMTIAAPATPKGQFAINAYQAADDSISKSDAIGVGPGMGTGPGSIRLVRDLATNITIPRVFDADALNVIGKTHNINVHGPAVLTPHPGEMERLSGVSAKDRPGQIEAAFKYARSTNCVLLLKGSQTFITDGQSRWFNLTGNPGMASGGSGDCLTGIIASLLGQKFSPWDAARLGAFVHGLAGDFAAEHIGEAGMVATDLLNHLSQAIRQATSDD